MRRLLLAAGGGGAVTIPVLTAFDVAASPSGGWSWFTDPRAIYYGDRTYFGYVNGSGDVAMRWWNGSLSSEFVLHSALEADDHDNPSFLVRDSDHKLLVFYTKHSDTTIRLRISTTSLDTDPDLSDGFAAEVSLDASLGDTVYTYPNPIQLTAEANDPIYLFYRDVSSGLIQDLTYGKSVDNGATWASGVTVARDTSNSDRCYWKIVQNGTDRIDFAFTDGHPQHDAPTATSTYHFYYEGGAYFKSDGTSAGSLPLDKTDMTLVHSGADDTSWVHDIAIGADGHPRIVYATFPTDTDHRYRYARWTGTEWQTAEIAAAGTYIPTAVVDVNPIESYYSGGVSLDHTDTDTVWASIQTGAGRWDIYCYRTTDDGATWSGFPLTSSGKNVRPVGVRNADPGLAALWMTGTYASYVSYATGTRGAGS